MSGFGAGHILAGRFELVRRVGAGGLAEVFQARDQLSGQEVALKALHAHLSEDAALSTRFRRELAVTRGLDHPGIVRVFDLHEHEGRPFISMELLRGRTLADRLREGPLQREEALRVAQRICEALRAAHRAGVVHRDLKPQNVFLTDEGGVKLLDFGLGRVIGTERFTAQSAVMGTPGYIAPELLSGAEADARADVYSLGVTLFEMLTGRQAFPGLDPFEVVRKQREGAPRLPGPEGEVVRRALEPDPERRYFDADQVLRELGGERVPLPPEPDPALSGGELDVIVSHEDFAEGRKLAAMVSRLGGGRLSLGWRAWLLMDGKNRLAAGVDRATAELLTELCREQGVPARVAPKQRRLGALEWLGQRSAWIGAGLAVALEVALFTYGTVMDRMHWQATFAERPWWLVKDLLVDQLYFAALVFAPVAGVLSLFSSPPLKDLPRGDPALRRLLAGIARRVARLRERALAMPEEHQMILGDLVAEAAEIERVASALGEAAQPSAAEAPVSAEAETLPQGSSRDSRAARLLDIAAALDDALAVVEEPAPTVQAASGAVSRLRGEIGFAQRALASSAGVETAPAAVPVKV